jgi:serine/threonine protein kinase
MAGTEKTMDPHTDTGHDRLSELRPGSRIAQYEVVKTLGSGGVGKVYLARHQLLEHLVAIKVHEEIPSDPVIRDAFRRSSSYLCQLRHDHIVTFINYGIEDERSYLVMEWVDGQSLRSMIDSFQTEAGFTLAVDYLMQLLDAVHYSHNCRFLDLDGSEKRGIIHGDIKPENILVSRNRIKLTDFMVPDVQRFLALRHHAAFSGQATTPTGIFGTPYYMSPEQLVQGEVSDRTDVFSLGVTFFHLLTGRYPYKNPEYLLNASTGGRFSSCGGKELSVTRLNPYVPEWVDGVIERATQLNEQDRYQSVAEMRRDVSTHRKKPQAETVIVNMKEVFMGDQTRIEIGEISGTSGQMYLGKFNNVISTLDGAGHSELVSAVSTIKEAVLRSAELSETQKREIIELLTKFTEESGREKPNHTIVKSLGEGVMSVLKAVPDVAKAVAALAPFIARI